MHAPCLSSRRGRVGGSLSPYWQVWSKLSKLTNYRVYQGLVYGNDVLKTMLTGSTYPSLSSSPAAFARLFSMRFPLSWSLEQASAGLADSLFCITCSLKNNAFSVLHYISKSYFTVLNVPSIQDPFSLGIFTCSYRFIMLPPRSLTSSRGCSLAMKRMKCFKYYLLAFHEFRMPKFFLFPPGTIPYPSVRFSPHPLPENLTQSWGR